MNKQPPMTSKRKVKLTRTEEAIIYLAKMLERYDHYDYAVKYETLAILGLNPDKKEK